MSEIDWSKAPEGATHYDHWLDQPFIRFSGCEVWEFWNESKECWFAFTHYTPGKDVVKRPSKAWLGAGLPPVGTVCWVSRKSGQDSPYEGECTIVAHHMNGKNPVAVYVRGEPKGMYASIAMESCFSPLRTQEQIEAEEREKAIEEMIKVDDRGTLSRTVFCGMLYDAGYRKQGEAK